MYLLKVLSLSNGTL